MKKSLFAILLLTLTIVPAVADVDDTFTKNGVNYKVTSEDPKTVEIHGWTNDIEEYVVIPAEINGYTVTSIGANAFSYCTILDIIKLPTSVTSIGDDAFHACTNLRSMVLPASVTSIGSFSFSRCTNMGGIIIPASVTSIGDYVFSGSTNLTDIRCSGITPPTISSATFSGFIKPECVLTVPEGCIDIYKADKNWNGFKEYVEQELVLDNGDTFTVDGVRYSVTSVDSKTVEVSGYTDKLPANLTLPSEVIGYSVATIADGAFSGCPNLSSIEIPASVTSIGNNAFSGCSSLTSMTCLAATPPTASSMTFDGFDKSACTLTVPKGCVGTYQSAENWDGFKTYETVPSVGDTFTVDGVKYKISSVDRKTVQVSGFTDDLPANLALPVEVNGYAVKSIGTRGFQNCSKLTTIEIPNSVTSINARAFEGCENLQSIVIPESVTSFSLYLFSGCTNLTSMKCLATRPPTVSSLTFDGFDKSACTLTVPEGCAEAYQASSDWDGFNYDLTTSIESITAYDIKLTVNGTEVSVTGTDAGAYVYDLSGRTLLTTRERTFTLPKGVAIIVISGRTFKISLR